VLGGGSELGIKSFLEGKADIAASSRTMKEAEKVAFEQRTGTCPMEYVVALDGIGVYVHNNNPLTRLTVSQLSRILTGEIRNWRQVGGQNRRVDIYNRDRNSGIRAFIREYVLEGKSFSSRAREVSTTSMVTASVSRNQSAIGYGGIAYSEGSHIIRLSKHAEHAGFWPGSENISSGKYPLSRPLYYYVNPVLIDEEIESFLDWVSGPEGQSVVTFVGYYAAPSPKVEDLRPELSHRPVPLNPDNMGRHGFELTVTISDSDEKLRPGQVKLTTRFSPSGRSIQKIRTLSLRIGDEAQVPLRLGSDLALEFALRKDLIEKTSIYLAEAGAPLDGIAYVVNLSVFCSDYL
jgi:phosphate transport system substrate-binding protein